MVWPSSPRLISSSRRMRGSSSTIRIFAIVIRNGGPSQPATSRESRRPLQENSPASPFRREHQQFLIRSPNLNPRRTFSREERIEYLLLKFFRYAWPCIRNIDSHFACPLTRSSHSLSSNRKFTALAHCLTGIRDQVCEHLLAEFTVNHRSRH